MSVYRYTIIPIGPVHYSKENFEDKVGIPIDLIANFEFQPDAIPPWEADSIRETIRQNPIVQAHGKEMLQLYDSMGNKTQLVTVELLPFEDGDSLQAKLDRLAWFLTTGLFKDAESESMLDPISKVLIKKMENDEEFEKETTQRFCNVAEIHESLVVRRNVLASFVSHCMSSSINKDLGESKQHSEETDTYGDNQSLILELNNRLLSFLVEGNFTDQIDNKVVEDENFRRCLSILKKLSGVYREDKARLGPVFERYFSGLSIKRDDAPEEGLHLKYHVRESRCQSQEDLKENLESGELNTVMATLCKDPALSMFFGLRSKWIAWIPTTNIQSMRGSGFLGVNKRLLPDPNHKPSAWWLHRELIAPLSTYATSRGGGFSELNDQFGNQRYSTLTVTAENDIANNTVAQDSNRVSESAILAIENNDDPRQTELDNYEPEDIDKRGITERTTNGVAFFGPIEDLVNKSEPGNPNPIRLYRIKDRVTREKFQWLEDLWVGYRIDIMDLEQKDLGYLSLHKGNKTVAFKNNLKVPFQFEGYFEREQLLENLMVSNEITTWSGTGQFERLPFCEPKVFSNRDEDSNRAFSNESNSFEDPRCQITEPIINGPYTEIFKRQQPRTSPRLYFKGNYRYRLRNTFIGGAGLSLGEADLAFKLAMDDAYTQDFAFRRSKSLKPGEFVMPKERADDEERDKHDSRKIIHLHEFNKTYTFYLAPLPIHGLEIFFHQYVKSFADVQDKNIQNAVQVEDLGKWLLDSDGSIRFRSYFLDPEVCTVVVSLTVLNWNDHHPPTTREHCGRVCTMVEPLLIKREEVAFGEPGDPWTFRPICITLVTSDGTRPVMRKKSWFHSNRSIEVCVPSGMHVRLNFYPKFEEEMKTGTAWSQEIKKYLKAGSQRGKGVGANFPFLSESDSNLLSQLPNPYNASARSIECVHVTQKPLSPPIIRELGVKREIGESNANLIGVIDIDAKTTDAIYLTASWIDILDERSSLSPIEISDNGSSPERNVVSQIIQRRNICDSEAPIGSQINEILKYFGKWCNEDTIIFRRTDPKKSSVGGGPAIINFKDGRRRIARIHAYGITRNRNTFPNPGGKELFRTSEEVTIDVPSSKMPPQIHISHSVPLLHRSETVDDFGNNVIREEFGLKIYLDRPFHETGYGERVAIGFASDRIAENPLEEDNFYRAYAATWGEHPGAIRRAPSVQHYPRAKDIQIWSHGYEKEVKHDRGQPSLYVYDSVELTIDNENEPVPTSKPIELQLNLASFVPNYDKYEKLWFIEVQFPEDFAGWVILPIYRHQPNPCSPKLEISKAPDRLYARVFDGTVISYVKRDSWLKVVVGPVLDSSLKFRLRKVQPLADGIAYTADSEATKFDAVKKENGTLHFASVKAGSSYHLESFVPEPEEGSHQSMKKTAETTRAVIAVIDS